MSSKKQRVSARISRASETPEPAVIIQKLSESQGSNSSMNSSYVSTRHDEKEFLGGLNSRLASYIERVRQLEQENNRLVVQIKDTEVIEKKEKDNLSHRYENEMARLRKEIDYVNGRFLKLEVERDAAVASRDEVQGLIARLQKDLKTSETARASAQSLVDSYIGRLNTAENKAKDLDKENAELNREVERLRKQLAGAQKLLEDETCLRAETQTKNRTLQEELEFERGNHREQLEDVRRKRQVEMTTISRQIESEYENTLNERLDEMRADFANKLAANRNNFEEQYKNKINDAREMADRFREEASRLRIQLAEIQKKGAGAESELEALNRRINALEYELERTRREMNEKLSAKDDRIYELNEEIQRMMAEYQDLIDIKIQLDAELQAYQAMLDGEESRLNITANSGNASSRMSFSSATQSIRGTKRRRVSNDNVLDYLHSQRRFESGNIGGICIDNADIEGKSITLLNTTDEDISLGGWTLKVTADNREIVYKFNNKLVARPHETITVWSANSAHKHSPPHDLVMKSQNWPIGPNPEAGLYNADDERQAWMVAVQDESGENPNDRCLLM